jgi:hypothetical protein
MLKRTTSSFHDRKYLSFYRQFRPQKLWRNHLILPRFSFQPFLEGADSEFNVPRAI